MAEKKSSFTIHIYNLEHTKPDGYLNGPVATTHHQLTMPDAVRLLKAVRSGLPQHCVASMTEAIAPWRNVQA